MENAHRASLLIALAQENGLLAWGTLGKRKPSGPEQHGLVNDDRTSPWRIQAQIHHEMFAALNGHTPTSEAVMVMASPSGSFFGVVEHRVGTKAHRVLIPLAGDGAWEFKIDSSGKLVNLLLSCARTHQVISRTVPFKTQYFAQVQKSASQSLNVATLGSEIADLAIQMLKLDSLSGKDARPKAVAVTVVLTEELQMLFKASALRTMGGLH